jgi:tetratricopeptide (TPR) repeat protein/transglutaminase-like putative cysteine protease
MQGLMKKNRFGVFSIVLLALLVPWEAAWADQNQALALIAHNQFDTARSTVLASIRSDRSDTRSLAVMSLLDNIQDDALASAEHIAPVYQLAPASPLAAALWPEFCNAARSSGRLQLITQAALEIDATPAPSYLKASAETYLVDHATRSGQLEQAQLYAKKLGYVKGWHVIGPFPNDSRSGLSAVYGPENSAETTASYPGKDDVVVAWHVLKTVTPTGVCNVGDSLGSDDPGTFYAQTVIASTRQRRVICCFNPTGQSKVFVNGKLLFSDSIPRAATSSFLADMFTFPADLVPGENVVLVKVSADKGTDCAFSFRVAGDDGAPSSQPDPPVLPVVHSPWLDGPQASGADLLDTELKSGIEEEEQDYTAAEKTTVDALKVYPGCAMLHSDLSKMYDDDERSDDARAEREAAHKLSDAIAPVEDGYFTDHIDALSGSEAISEAKNLSRQFPHSSTTAWILARAYAKAGLQAEATHVVQQAIKYEYGASDVDLFQEILADHGEYAAQKSMYVDALQDMPDNSDLLMNYGELLQQYGDTAGAIKQFRTLLAVDGDSAAVLRNIADAYIGALDSKNAVVALRSLIAVRPQDADDYADLADNEHSLGQNQSALAHYREAIRLDPGRIELRDKVGLLTGAKPVLDLVPAISGSAVPTYTPPAPGADTQSAVVLLDECRMVVYPDGASEGKFHRIVKILDASGSQDYQKVVLYRPTSHSVLTLEVAKVIDPHGKAQDCLGDSSDDEVDFPSLTPGDTIDYAYHVDDYETGGLAHQFWADWFFSATDAVTKLSRFVLVTAPETTFKLADHGQNVPVPTVTQTGGWTITQWRATDVPAHVSSPYHLVNRDSGSWIDISSITSWKQIEAWYQELADSRCVPDDIVCAKAHDLTSGCTTDAEKIAALTAFVTHEIQYQSTPFRLSAFVPTEGKQVLRELYGDCKDKAALLVAMLKAVGITGHMVLVSPRTAGVTPYLPSPRFNHAIAVVDTATGPIWVDGTADNMPSGVFPLADQGVPALIIDGKSADLSTTPEFPKSADQQFSRFVGSLDSSLTLTAKCDMSFTGNDAWLIREVFSSIGADHQDQMLRAIASQEVSGSVYDMGSLEGLGNENVPMHIHLAYHSPDAATTAGNFLLVQVPWHADTPSDRLVEAAKENEPLELPAALNSTVTLDLTVPAGYQPEDLKPDLRKDYPFGSYAYTYSFEGSTLHVKKVTTVTEQRIPKDEVAQFADFVQEMKHQDQQQIVLHHTAG